MCLVPDSSKSIKCLERYQFIKCLIHMAFHKFALKPVEDIDNDDAELLANYMICKKPFKGISLKVIKEAFPQLIKETA